VVAPQIRDAISGRDQNPYMITPPSRRKIALRRLFALNTAVAQAAILAKGLKDFAASRVLRERPRPASSMSIYAAHGSLLALSAGYFDSGGTLDHPMFLFGEEMHVARECTRIGLTVHYEPRMRATHTSHAQTGYFRSRTVLKSAVRAAKYEHVLASDFHGRRRAGDISVQSKEYPPGGATRGRLR
jgi:hypothetical protein